MWALLLFASCSQPTPKDTALPLPLTEEEASAHDAEAYAEARAKLKELHARYPSEPRPRSRPPPDYTRLIGTAVRDMGVEHWYGGFEASFDEGTATLLVFFETWCPHCNSTMPAVESLHLRQHARGLNVIGITKGTRGSTDQVVGDFIADHGLTFPIARERNGSLSQAFAVQGIPAAAVIRDGTIVWRGHPSKITDENVDDWLR